MLSSLRELDRFNQHLVFINIMSILSIPLNFLY